MYTQLPHRTEAFAQATASPCPPSSSRACSLALSSPGRASPVHAVSLVSQRRSSLSDASTFSTVQPSGFPQEVNTTAPSESRRLTPTRATYLISVLGKDASVEALAEMANMTVEELKAELGADFVRILRISSSSQSGGEWI